jgi:hypothetical protein
MRHKNHKFEASLGCIARSYFLPSPPPKKKITSWGLISRILIADLPLVSYVTFGKLIPALNLNFLFCKVEIIWKVVLGIKEDTLKC